MSLFYFVHRFVFSGCLFLGNRLDDFANSYSPYYNFTPLHLFSFQGLSNATTYDAQLKLIFHFPSPLTRTTMSPAFNIIFCSLSLSHSILLFFLFKYAPRSHQHTHKIHTNRIKCYANFFIFNSNTHISQFIYHNMQQRMRNIFYAVVNDFCLI